MFACDPVLDPGKHHAPAAWQGFKDQGVCDTKPLGASGLLNFYKPAAQQNSISGIIYLAKENFNNTKY